MIDLQPIPIHIWLHIRFAVRQFFHVRFLLSYVSINFKILYVNVVLFLFCYKGNPFRREVHYQGLQRQQHRNSKWPDKQYMQVI